MLFLGVWGGVRDGDCELLHCMVDGSSTCTGAAGEKYTERKAPTGIMCQPPKRGSLFDAAPHVLPPMSIVCQHYLKSLLPPTQTETTPQ